MEKSTIPQTGVVSEPKYEQILQEKIDYYGETRAAYHFAAEEYARQYHEWMKSVEKSNDANLPAIGSYTIHSDIDCPKCGLHHVDKDEWAKRLHRQHFCEGCGHIWQPHEGYTFGV